MTIHSCRNTIGSYECTCGAGYSYHVDSKSCKDINECLSQDHGCEFKCINTKGSYKCACDEPFFSIDKENKKKCRDVNECTETTHCLEHDNKECVNKRGGFECFCVPNRVYNSTSDVCEFLDYYLITALVIYNRTLLTMDSPFLREGQLDLTIKYFKLVVPNLSVERGPFKSLEDSFQEAEFLGYEAYTEPKTGTLLVSVKIMMKLIFNSGSAPSDWAFGKRYLELTPRILVSNTFKHSFFSPRGITSLLITKVLEMHLKFGMLRYWHSVQSEFEHNDRFLMLFAQPLNTTLISKILGVSNISQEYLKMAEALNENGIPYFPIHKEVASSLPDLNFYDFDECSSGTILLILGNCDNVLMNAAQASQRLDMDNDRMPEDVTRDLTHRHYSGDIDMDDEFHIPHTPRMAVVPADDDLVFFQDSDWTQIVNEGNDAEINTSTSTVETSPTTVETSTTTATPSEGNNNLVPENIWDTNGDSEWETVINAASDESQNNEDHFESSMDFSPWSSLPEWL
ncbi:hypothetical protein Ciccas_011366 [Cichlidogyrus casuarinus]|uniref:Uncharacterized protein n=1 Tax=Cichlidogyrus casuarinus TaxID=1844966 RepID=A0ABD2PS44_9PLAT